MQNSFNNPAPAVLTAAVLCWLGYSSVPWPGWTEFCVQLPVLLEDCPSILLSLPRSTYAM